MEVSAGYEVSTMPKRDFSSGNTRAVIRGSMTAETTYVRESVAMST